MNLEKIYKKFVKKIDNLYKIKRNQEDILRFQKLPFLRLIDNKGNLLKIEYNPTTPKIEELINHTPKDLIDNAFELIFDWNKTDMKEKLKKFNDYMLDFLSLKVHGDPSLSFTSIWSKFNELFEKEIEV